MGVLDEVKSIAKTVQQIDNIELYRKILDLQAQIMDLLEDNSKLKEEITDLKKKLSIQQGLVFQDDAYWLPKSGTGQEGPFCSNCWDVRNQLVRMHFCSNREYSECPTCKKSIKIHRVRD